MQNQQSRPPNTPRSIQIKYLLQALVVIAVTGVTILLLFELAPFELAGPYFRTTEIYFLAIIANLVFFHTLAYHIIEEALRRVVFGTAVTTLVTSALMYSVYYLLALWQ